MTIEIEKIQDLQIAELRDGDLLIIKTNRVLPVAIAELIVNQVSRFLPKNKCIVLEDGMSLEVVRSEHEHKIYGSNPLPPAGLKPPIPSNPPQRPIPPQSRELIG